MCLFQNQIHEHQECNNCTLWKLTAGEVWGQEFLNIPSSKELLDIGFWNPREGLHLSDEVFPHSVHGFRGRNLPLAAFHVNKLNCYINKLFYYRLETYKWFLTNDMIILEQRYLFLMLSIQYDCFHFNLSIHKKEVLTF